MKYYSFKQLNFAKDLCNRFGIDNREFIDDFLNYYAINYGSYQKKEKDWVFTVTKAIDALITENEIRKKRSSLKLKTNDFSHLRAIDLANFTFCPASFSISNTFDIEYPSGEKEREIGEKLHNELKLIKRIENYKVQGKNELKFDDPIIIEILKSEIVYSGHKKLEKSFFNSELNIASEPDYIFKDRLSNHFVVEEKYQYKKNPRTETFKDKELKWESIYSERHVASRKKEIEEWDNYNPSFYLNHQIQLFTYLKSITEFNLKYGYLVYWYYDYNKEKTPYIHKVCAKKFIINEQTLDFFNKTYTNIRNFIKVKKCDFDYNKVSANKCGGCMVNKYCGHKNKKYSDLSFPYKTDYLKLYYV